MSRKYQVYELTNLDRGEVVIGISAAAKDHRDQSDAARKEEWQRGDRVTFRVLEDFVHLADAAEFAVIYSETHAIDPRRVHIGPDLALESARQPA